MQTAGSSSPGHPRRWWILGVLASATAMITLNNSLLGVAIPALIRALDARPGDIQWIMDGYSLTFAALLLTAGAISDRYGRKRTMLLGTVGFGVGSLIALMAAEPSHLIAARAVMGLSAAFIMPSTLSIVTEVFPANERPKAIAVWSSVSVLGVVVGPLVGGALVSHYWWGSVFLVNLFPVVGVLAAGMWLLPESAAQVPQPINPVGAVLGGGAIVGLVYGLIEASGGSLSSPQVLGPLALSAVLGVLFVAWEKRHPAPLVDMTLMRRPPFLGASMGATVLLLGFSGAGFVLVQQLQFALGFTPLQAGLGILPMPFALIVGSIFAPTLTQRAGPYSGVSYGLLIVAIGTFALGQTGSEYWIAVVGLVLIGVGGGLALTPATDMIIILANPDRTGSASALNDTMQELGTALGVAVVGTVMARAYTDGTSELPPQARHDLASALDLATEQGPKSAAKTVATAQEAFAHATALSLSVAAVLIAIGAVLAFVLLPGMGSGKHRAALGPEPAPAPPPSARARRRRAAAARPEQVEPAPVPAPVPASASTSASASARAPELPRRQRQSVMDGAGGAAQGAVRRSPRPSGG